MGSVKPAPLSIAELSNIATEQSALAAKALSDTHERMLVAMRNKISLIGAVVTVRDGLADHGLRTSAIEAAWTHTIKEFVGFIIDTPQDITDITGITIGSSQSSEAIEKDIQQLGGYDFQSYIRQFLEKQGKATIEQSLDSVVHEVIDGIQESEGFFSEEERGTVEGYFQVFLGLHDKALSDYLYNKIHENRLQRLQELQNTLQGVLKNDLERLEASVATLRGEMEDAQKQFSFLEVHATSDVATIFRDMSENVTEQGIENGLVSIDETFQSIAKLRQEYLGSKESYNVSREAQLQKLGELEKEIGAIQERLSTLKGETEIEDTVQTGKTSTTETVPDSVTPVQESLPGLPSFSEGHEGLFERGFLPYNPDTLNFSSSARPQVQRVTLYRNEGGHADMIKMGDQVVSVQGDKYFSASVNGTIRFFVPGKDPEAKYGNDVYKLWELEGNGSWGESDYVRILDNRVIFFDAQKGEYLVSGKKNLFQKFTAIQITDDEKLNNSISGGVLRLTEGEFKKYIGSLPQ